MVLARPSSAGMGAGEGDFQGVEIPRPIKNAQKGSQTNTTTPIRHQETVRNRSG